ncbi:Lrp/AsnC family transcriptional regulator [Haloarcula onubensis]|uniref:Lrp/AsnC family transcriptional regulator n=1 Tax=Haloarcula onubensis TaxID=2950539 RepID=A0ABU2FPJ7_9EURY|nr:Lrp/AsnC family transcriptional regulator [Halomicroarcula sp. S3CR25-11]MDS0282669.1 Lrp/AsnC family transcriptional regulator [Halomicroarcula sp. S3CR25-11]
MTLKGLDELDRYIIHELQRDVKDTSSKEIADAMDVSPSTVRKRIDRLEEKGIITGYHADVDYGKAGYQLHMQIVCTAPIQDREELGRQALDIFGVVSVREIATGADNLLVGVVARDNDDLTRIAGELSALGLATSDEQLVRGDRFTPYQGFIEADETAVDSRPP